MFYTVLGIQSNFLSNVNSMILPLFICPIIYFIMTAVGKNNDDFKIRPRLLNYGKTFLLDVPFTIVLVNIPNICVSFVVSLQAFGMQNIVSFVSSLLLALLVLITGILFLVFKSGFREYRNEFCQRLQMCKMSIKASTEIKRLYPIAMLIEMALISSILAIESLMFCSLYVCLGIMVAFSVIFLIVAPYSYTIDNVRLFIHRFLLISVCGLQIGFRVLRVEDASKNNFVYDYPWLVLVVLLISLGLNVPYLVYNSILWLKSPNMIDMKLYNEKHPMK